PPPPRETQSPLARDPPQKPLPLTRTRIPLSAPRAPHKHPVSNLCAGRLPTHHPERGFAAKITRSRDQAAPESIHILAPGARPARLSRTLPDPRGDDVPDQPLVGRH